MAKGKKKKRIKGLIITGCIIAMLAIAFSFVSTKPRVRMFLSVINFSERTLKDKYYLLSGIDIMELFHDYANGETVITGHMGIDGVEKVKASVYVDVDARRSFSQKRFAAKSRMKLLVLDMGEMNAYAEGETVYFDVPILGDFGYSFPTGIDLFMKMPDMTSDLDSAWFRDNLTEIIEFMSDMGLEQTGRKYVDAEGVESEEFVITIPKGKGKFIWDLMGMEMPDYDVVVSMFLDKHNSTRRVELSLEDVLPGAKIVTIGENVRTMYLYYELPENERVVTKVERDEAHPSMINVFSTYYANNDKEYRLTTYITWERADNGFDIKLNDIVVYEGDKEIGNGYFSGNVLKTTDTSDVFEGKEGDLYGFEELNWREIRDDFDSFVNDILDKLNISLPGKE